MLTLIEQDNAGGGALSQVQPSQALSVAESSRKVAEVQAALTVAAARPRNTMLAVDRITNACGRVRLAESATYQFARGGTDIAGASIRLLEAIAGAWGNLEYGFRELAQGNGESTVEAFAWDLETNTKRSTTFVVPHKVGMKGGKTKPLTDPRDVYEWVANQAQRRVRSCLENIIPRDVIDEAIDQCADTLRAKADVSPEGVAKLVKAFAEIGVEKEQLEVRIQRRLSAIQPGQLIQLRRIYMSIKDGMSSTSDWFDEVPKTETPKTEKPKDEPASASPAEVYRNRIAAAATHEDVIAIAAELDGDDSLEVKDSKELGKLVNDRVKALGKDEAK